MYFMGTNLIQLPSDIPRPLDDGQADHLWGAAFPSVKLLSTDGATVATDSFKNGRYIIYCYPMTGRPDVPLPKGWDSVPGARGCTPESLMFAQHYAELKNLGFMVYGLSTQSQEYQREMVERLHLPFPILSDSNLLLTKALMLPTLIVEGQTLLKRLTMVVENGVIRKVFYPVFPPDKHPEEVLYWAKHAGRG